MNKDFLVLSAFIGLILPQLAQAIEFGGITVYSNLNEKLDAEILILSANENEKKHLSVSLGSDAVFAEYDIKRTEILNDLKFRVVNNDGCLYVKAISKNKVTTSYINFALQLKTPSGVVSHEYVAFLYPVGSEAGRAAASKASSRCATENKISSKPKNSQLATESKISDQTKSKQLVTESKIPDQTKNKQLVTESKMPDQVKNKQLVTESKMPDQAKNKQLVTESKISDQSKSGQTAMASKISSKPEFNHSDTEPQPNATITQPVNSNSLVIPQTPPLAISSETREYGPIRDGQTLLSIATATRPTVQQMAELIRRANPGAFSEDGLKLVAGSVLNIPTIQDVTTGLAAFPATTSSHFSISDAKKKLSPNELRLADHTSDLIVSPVSTPLSVDKASRVTMPSATANSTLNPEILIPEETDTLQTTNPNTPQITTVKATVPTKIVTNDQQTSPMAASNAPVNPQPAIKATIRNSTVNPQPAAEAMIRNPTVNPIPASRKVWWKEVLDMTRTHAIYIGGGLMGLILAIMSLKYIRQRKSSGNDQTTFNDQSDVDDLLFNREINNDYETESIEAKQKTLGEDSLVMTDFNESTAFNNANETVTADIGKVDNKAGNNATKDDFVRESNSKAEVIQTEKAIESVTAAAKTEINFDNIVVDDSNLTKLKTTIKQPRTAAEMESKEAGSAIKLTDELVVLNSQAGPEPKANKDMLSSSHLGKGESVWATPEQLGDKSAMKNELHKNITRNFPSNAEQEKTRMQMKLDLANSFISISELTRARELLDEVLVLGTDEQKDRAKTLLTKI